MQKTIFTKDFECKHTDLVQQRKFFQELHLFSLVNK